MEFVQYARLPVRRYALMARSRNIKPGFFYNDRLVEMSFEFRLLFIGLWTLADREGRLEDRPKKIKMEVFPADVVDVDAGLNALSEGGFVSRYEVDGKKCIQILAWAKHQNPHPREAASVLPSMILLNTCQGMEEAYPRHEQALEIQERAGLIPSSLIPDSLQYPLTPSDEGESSANVSPKKRGKSRIELKTYVEQCEAAGVQAITADDPVFAYADRIGLPVDYLELAWNVFRDKLWIGKKQASWTQTFRNYVEGNYLKLWFQGDGGWGLTTAGKQAKLAYGARAAA